MDDQAELSSLLDLIRRRRAVRHLLSDPVPQAVMAKLLDAARWAPSGYNLQPTHFVVVTDPAVKARLQSACLDQHQVAQAGAVVVFCGDTRVADRHFEQVLAQEKAAGSISAPYESALRRFVPLGFSTRPWGLGWICKALLGPTLGRWWPVPSLPAVHRRYWLAKQVGLAAMNFMLAAQAAGLATCPMEGFSERAVRRALRIPSDMAVVLVVPVGRADKPNQSKTRLPLEELTHHEGW